MRTNIIEQLPELLPRDKSVFILRPQTLYGEGSFNSFLSTLDRRSDWIRVETGDVTESRITEKVGFILTMVGSKPGAVDNMRKAGKKLRIPCPKQAFTVSETKEVLRQLAERREGKPDTSVANDAGIPSLTIVVVSPDADDAGEQAVETMLAVMPDPEETMPAVSTAQPPKPSGQVTAVRDLMISELGDIGSAIQQAIENLQFLEIEEEEGTEELQAQLKALCVELEAKNYELHARDIALVAKDREIDGLRASLSRHEGELSNVRLELQTTVQVLKVTETRACEFQQKYESLSSDNEEMRNAVTSLSALAAKYKLG